MLSKNLGYSCDIDFDRYGNDSSNAINFIAERAKKLASSKDAELIMSFIEKGTLGLAIAVNEGRS